MQCMRQMVTFCCLEQKVQATRETWWDGAYLEGIGKSSELKASGCGVGEMAQWVKNIGSSRSDSQHHNPSS